MNVSLCPEPWRWPPDSVAPALTFSSHVSKGLALGELRVPSVISMDITDGSVLIVQEHFWVLLIELREEVETYPLASWFLLFSKLKDSIEKMCS